MKSLNKVVIKGLLICFIGIDGSGKTTLSKEVVKSLRKQGLECNYVYARLNPFLSRPIMLVGRLLFLNGRETTSRNYIEYSTIKRSLMEYYPILSRIYLQILLVDFYFQIFFKVKIPLKLGKNIVCDRYVYDTVITDFSVHLNYSIDKIVNLVNNLLRLIPKPNIIFLIDVPEEVAYQRKNDIVSIEYLREKRWIYLKVGEKYNAILVDGTKPLKELKVSVQHKVFEYIKERT